jgi:hypothetical protein
VYIFEQGNILEFTNPSHASETLHVFLGAGRRLPQEDSWVKLLGHNGFIIAKDEEEASMVMTKIEETGDDFTYRCF